MGLSKISMWYAHQNKNIILNQKKISLSMANSKHQTRQISSLFFLFLSVMFFLFPCFFLLDLLLLAAILPFGLRFVLGFFPVFFWDFFPFSGARWFSLRFAG